MTGENWNVGYYPDSGEDLVFDGSISNRDCVGLGIKGGYNNSIRIINGYSGTIYVEGIDAGTLELASPGAHLLQVMPDRGAGFIGVSEQFIWTGGRINDTPYHNDVVIGPGATATINPAVGLLTGSTITFESYNSWLGTYTPSTGVILPGAVEFANGAGLTIKTLCTVDVGDGSDLPPLPATQFFDKQGDPQQIPLVGTIRVEGRLNVNTKLDTKLPVLVSGGTFEIMRLATANVSGQLQPIGAINTNVRIAGGRLIIHGLGKLQVPDRVVLENGSIGAVGTLQGTGDLPAAPATIQGTVEIIGGQVDINRDRNPHTFGLLKIVGDVYWRGGTYLAYVNPLNTSEADLLEITGKLYLGLPGAAGGTISISVVTSNFNIPVVGSAWQVITASGGIFDRANTDSFTAAPYSVELRDGNPPKTVYVKKN